MGKKAKKKKSAVQNQITNSVKTLPERTAFKVGDCVVVKEGTLDPDYGNDIGGWQGRVFEIDEVEDEPLLSIYWDSITMQNMSRSVIENCERDGLLFSEMNLYASEVQLTSPRDTEEEVSEAFEMMSDNCSVLEFDEDETEFDEDIERVRAILGASDEEDMEVTDENLEKYFQYLQENLEMPCIVTGMEDFAWEEFYVLGPGDEDEYEELKKTRPSYKDKYTLHSLDEDFDEDSGIYVKVERISDKQYFVLPLADLEAVDKTSRDYQILQDYSMWFVNYR